MQPAGPETDVSEDVVPLSRSTTRKIDGTRQRCKGCGHPRKEHLVSRGCTVPNCPCAVYDPPPSLKAQAEAEAEAKADAEAEADAKD